jgi:nitrite reductase/ring-hydroxylating ferredoxin subunit
MAQVTVAKASEVKAGEGRIVEAGGHQIALFNVSGKFCAIDNTCCHRGGPLGDGELDGQIVTCPWHGWQYDVTTGQCVAPSPKVSVKSYPVQVEGDEVKVEVS